MHRLIALIACIALGGLIAWGASRTPAPKPPSMGRFSGQAAMADVRSIAAKPHPIGSAEHERVRDYIVGRFRQLGLQVDIWEGQAYEARSNGGDVSVEGGHVQDIIAILPGRQRAEPALAIMAHYDTVPASPGAADDTVGVAAALEIARVLKGLEGSRAPKRDVVFLITDGEEAGLLGARAFFADNSLVRHVGAVLNMESRGGGGRAYMFETGPDNGPMIDLFRRTASNPTAASLSGYVYSHMPNDTDFTVSKRLGIPGMNYAFLGRPFDYHAASSTPDALDQGSLQHIGQQVLGAARALAQASKLPGKSPDVVYGDLLGGPIVVYPVWGGWIALAAAALLAALALRRAFKNEPLRLVDALRGAGASLLTVALAAGLTALVRFGTGASSDFALEKALISRFSLYETALAAACLGAMALSFFVAGLGRTHYWGALAGALALALLLTALLQAAAPLVAFMLCWPLLVAAALAAAAAFRWHAAWDRPSYGLFAAVIGAVALAQILYLAHPIALGIGADLPEALAAVVLMAALVLFPLLWPAPGQRWLAALGGVSVALALGLTLLLRFTDPWSPRHPQPTDILYVADVRGPQWRASILPSLDPWSARAVTAAGGKTGRVDLRPLTSAAYAAKAEPLVVSETPLKIVRSRDGRVAVDFAGTRVRQIRLDVTAAEAVSLPAINGKPVSAWAGAGHSTHLVWNAPLDGLSLTFLAPKGAVDIRWAEIIDGWPGTPLPPRPANAMPWMNSDNLAIIGAAHLQ